MEEFDGKRENKELFTADRWTEPPVFQVIGHTEFSEEEKKENDKRMNDILKKYGVIKEDTEKTLSHERTI